MAERYLKTENGRLKSVEAVDESSGGSSAGKIVALDAEGFIAQTMLRESATLTLTASESLSGGALVNIWDETGTPSVRNATNGSSGKECDGFVLDTATAASSVQVYFEGVVSGLTSLTVGSRYYLGVDGALTTTPPSETDPANVGKVIQYIGRAISETELAFEPDDAIEIV
jgi:hypothetical protein